MSVNRETKENQIQDLKGRFDQSNTFYLLDYVNIPVAGLRDKWIYLPVGAEDDLARVSQTGSVRELPLEKVGEYDDRATVYYNQEKSDYLPLWINDVEPLHDPNESYYKSRKTIDLDNFTSAWNVRYNSGGTNGEIQTPDDGIRRYTLFDDLGNAVVARAPEWSG